MYVYANFHISTRFNIACGGALEKRELAEGRAGQSLKEAETVPV